MIRANAIDDQPCLLCQGSQLCLDELNGQYLLFLSAYAINAPSYVS